MVWVRAGEEALQSLALHPSVAHVYANPSVQTPMPAEQDPVPDLSSPEAIEWNLLKVEADEVWARGIRGQGVVIGGQDTGYDWDHPAIKQQYRGWNGVSADHNYNWHVPSTVLVCTPDILGDPDSIEPCDDNGHGTHTMGTMVGEAAPTRSVWRRKHAGLPQHGAGLGHTNHIR
jgi:subtilisin family serine protease